MKENKPTPTRVNPNPLVTIITLISYSNTLTLEKGLNQTVDTF
jgi:hypothetical protein